MVNEHANPVKVITLIILLGFVSSLLLWIGGDSPLGSNPPREFFYTFFSYACGVITLLLIALSPNLNRLPLKTWHILILACLLRIIAIQAWPLLEDDYFRYLWDGRQTALYLAPWKFPPLTFFEDDSLSQAWQSVLNGINHPELPTLYGPVLQYLFAAAYFLDPGQLWPIQLLLLLTDMVILLILISIGLNNRWLLAYAVHPLILKESMASAHPDSLMVLWLLLASICWQRKKGVASGLLIGLALGTKISALVTIPFLLISPVALITNNIGKFQEKVKYARILQLSHTILNSLSWSITVIIAMASALIALYTPFLLSGIEGSEFTSLITFGQQWRFNPLIYRLFDSISFIKQTRVIVFVVTLMSISLLLVYWVLNNKKTLSNGSLSQTIPIYPPLDLALFLLLIFSPVVNNWYWLWLLPLALIQRRAWLIASCTIGVLAYINSTVFYDTHWLNYLAEQDLFNVPWSITLLQLGLIFMIRLFFLLQIKK